MHDKDLESLMIPASKDNRNSSLSKDSQLSQENSQNIKKISNTRLPVKNPSLNRSRGNSRNRSTSRKDISMLIIRFYEK